MYLFLKNWWKIAADAHLTTKAMLGTGLFLVPPTFSNSRPKILPGIFWHVRCTITWVQINYRFCQLLLQTRKRHGRIRTSPQIMLSIKFVPGFQLKMLILQGKVKRCWMKIDCLGFCFECISRFFFIPQSHYTFGLSKLKQPAMFWLR